jgi:peptidoglycan/xylan/chitin deacetylase (PgdA/CDA1 family)
VRKIDILNSLSLLLLLFFFFAGLSWYFYVFVIIIHLGIIAFSASNIRSNFFLKAFNMDISANSKTICITFDDGPDADITPQILHILSEFNAKASFFVIGKKIAGNENILHQIDEAGHLIGNHSFNHTNLFPTKSSKEIIEELKQTSKEVQRVTGKYPQTFRPPFGVTNPNIAKAVKSLKWNVIGWNIRSLDTKRNSADITLQRVIKKCKPGSVVLFHDNIPETVTVLKEFLVFLNNHNYKIILPDEMFGLKWYSPYETD